MQRYFIDAPYWSDTSVTITGDDVHHISRVMRMGEGDQLTAVHPVHGPAVCKIDILSEEIVCSIIHWIEEDRELPVKVTIAAGLGKGDKLEQIVQKGTELGAFSFIPYQADRSVAKWDGKKAPKKIQRLEKIAKEAGEQSERTVIPSVSGLHSLKDITGLKETHDWCFFAHAEEARSETRRKFSDALHAIRPGDSIAVIFGPEGGFSDKEVEAFKEAGFLSIRLGPRILRMETAPLYFLSALSYVLEEA
ncbi:16S rRNA (uracil(1498)-N(3))-methyltransferase [Halobacillus litoralis]|uniref:16S rRNA (uracil(1498)-N(3))-methyltransferase n=1 Tax=Halobacillus litoralis TaxID=45668 RepID=UPI00136FB86C|nr:16S rRNA (uracil(1498)-N(3))-methyltransferase [Halobacillus litoralis]MYL37221.1 16S rRNA (uracil(1498)-N(3))-methyltransferase [Halobacillus litoralis]